MLIQCSDLHLIYVDSCSVISWVIFSSTQLTVQLLLFCCIYFFLFLWSWKHLWINLCRSGQLLNKLIPAFISSRLTMLLVFRSLNGLSPEYMNDMLVEYKPSRPLRSVQIVAHRVQTRQGEAAFSCYAAHNKLPAELKSAPPVTIFKSRLKMFPFSCAYNCALLKRSFKVLVFHLHFMSFYWL